MRRFVLAFAFLGLAACTPPVTELAIPTLASIQGKSYVEVVPTTKLSSALGTEEITAYLILPEIAAISVQEQAKEKGASQADIDFSTKAILARDELIFQVHLHAIKKDYVVPANWIFTLKDDLGNTVSGKTKNEGPIIPQGSGASGVKFNCDVQVFFDGYKIGAAKKVILTAQRKEGKPGTLTWVLPTDRTPVAAPASAPAPAAPAAP
jgi:hypothetical protein